MRNRSSALRRAITRYSSRAQAIVDTIETGVNKLSDVFQEGKPKHGQTEIVLAVSVDHVLKLILKYCRAFVVPTRHQYVVSWRKIEPGYCLESNSKVI